MAKQNAERPGVCLVIGAGPGVGASVARAFAREGLTVCVTRRPRNLPELEALAASIRDEGGGAHAFGVDAREEADMIALVDRIEADIGPLEVVVFNIGANVWFPIVETTTRVYTKVWEAALSGFIAAREAARVMTPRARGTILFTGATASVRGRAEFSAFSGAKHALRALAQSMARELGPNGVHVAHIICDGSIDGAFSRERFDDVEARLAADSILKPDEVAKNYVWLHQQGRSAWSFEIDLRPWSEPGDQNPRIRLRFRQSERLSSLSGDPANPAADRRKPDPQPLPPRRHLQAYRQSGADDRLRPRDQGQLAYEALETQRFIKRHGLSRFRMNPHFPINTLLIMRAAIAAELDGALTAYVEAVLPAMWEEGLKMDDPTVVQGVLEPLGLGHLMTAAQTDTVKSGLLANTQSAAERGVFGIPTFFVGDEMFFGKERLGQVEDELAA